ncbi:MAG: asparaginase domain-containing protein [Clostridia bacterium]|nr:asparaginase domain-containing protein [Clostridia bacterium]
MKINLVATGGTIGSRVVNGEYVISDEATRQIANVIGASKVFGEFKIHSAGVGLAALNTLRLTILDALEDKPDGVVVTHGTDTLAFSASYLAYAFADTKIPIVMCAADMPLTDYDSNGYDVLNAAKSFIARGERGVFVLYKNPGEVVKIHHGARLAPAHLHENFYHSIGTGRGFTDSGLMHGMDFELKNSDVFCISPYVGLNYGLLDVSRFTAVVHSAYHSGRVNVAEFNAFAKANPATTMFLISGKKKYSPSDFEKNVVLCSHITKTALYIKLLIALNNGVKDLAEFALKNVCGEIINN